MCERCEADPLSKHPRGHQVLKIREPVKGGERVTRERMSRAREVGGGGEGAGGEGAKGEAIPLASLGGGIERLLKSLGVGAPATAEKATSTEGVPRWATVVEGKGGDRTVVIDVDVSGAQVKHGQAPCDVEALVREAEKEGEEEQQVEVEVAAPVPAFEEEEAAPAEVAEKEVDQTLRASFVADVSMHLRLSLALPAHLTPTLTTGDPHGRLHRPLWLGIHEDVAGPQLGRPRLAAGYHARQRWRILQPRRG